MDGLARHSGGEAVEGRSGGPPLRWTRSVLDESTLFEVRQHRRGLKIVGWLAGTMSWAILIGWGAMLGAGWGREPAFWPLLGPLPLLAAFLVFVGLLTRGQAEAMHLEVAPEGLALSIAGWHLIAPWAAFAGIGRLARVPFAYRGLLLAEPVVAPGRFGRVSRLRGIPIDPFDPDWRTDGPLGREIRRHAPHLLGPPQAGGQSAA